MEEMIGCKIALIKMKYINCTLTQTILSMHRPSSLIQSAILASVAVLASCTAEQPEFPRYVTDDPYFNFPSTIKTVLSYEVQGAKETLRTKITAEWGNRLRHTYLTTEEESYDIDQYSEEGLLEERRSYRNGEVVLTNVYKSTGFGVPVLDYQLDRSGNKEEIWKAEADVAARVITKTQVAAIPFISNQDLTYTYNEHSQLISVVHKFPTRLFTEYYFYDSLGNVIRVEEKRTDREGSITKTEYSFDEYGNWISQKTSMTSEGKPMPAWGYRREIKYWEKRK